MFAGQKDVEAEDSGVFKWCLHNGALRQQYAMAIGRRGTRRDALGLSDVRVRGLDELASPWRSACSVRLIIGEGREGDHCFLGFTRSKHRSMFYSGCYAAALLICLSPLPG